MKSVGELRLELMTTQVTRRVGAVIIIIKFRRTDLGGAIEVSALIRPISPLSFQLVCLRGWGYDNFHINFSAVVLRAFPDS